MITKKNTMNWIALKILLGDKAKYIGLVFGITFATLLITQQCSIFVGVMNRMANFILDFRDVDIWVMDKTVTNLGIVEPLCDTALEIVRGVPGVKWAVPFLKVPAVVKPIHGKMDQALMVGLDDVSLVGLPHRFFVGDWSHLKEPNSVIVDGVGYEMLWPQDGSDYKLGKVLEINDQRAILGGVVHAIPSFQFLTMIYTRYSNALSYTLGERKRLHFVLVKAQEGFLPAEVARNIEKYTPFKARTRKQFTWETMDYYIKHTGIAINFGVTVLLGLLVGGVIVGLLLNMFVADNVKQFASLKAMGVENYHLILLLLTQISVVFLIGFPIGSALSSLFFTFAIKTAALRGMYLPWYIVGLTGLLIFLIMIVSSLFSFRRVLRIEPALVFKG